VEPRKEKKAVTFYENIFLLNIYRNRMKFEYIHSEKRNFSFNFQTSE